MIHGTTDRTTHSSNDERGRLRVIFLSWVTAERTQHPFKWVMRWVFSKRNRKMIGAGCPRTPLTSRKPRGIQNLSISHQIQIYEVHSKNLLWIFFPSIVKFGDSSSQFYASSSLGEAHFFWGTTIFKSIFLIISRSNSSFLGDSDPIFSLAPPPQKQFNSPTV